MNTWKYLMEFLDNANRWHPHNLPVINNSLPHEWKNQHIKYLALQKLVLASRRLVSQRQDDPDPILADIVMALEFYKDYWLD